MFEPLDFKQHVGFLLFLEEDIVPLDKDKVVFEVLDLT